MSDLFRFEMRAVVKDTLTGFEGVVIARIDYLNGTKQCLVQPRILDDGKMLNGKWIDEDRLQHTGDAPFDLGCPA